MHINITLKYSTILIMIIAVIAAGCSYLGLNDGKSAAPVYLSPEVIISTSDGSRLYIAETTAKQIAIFDTNKNQVTGSILLREQPNGLALSPDGSSLYVTCASPDGRIVIVSTSTGKVTGTLNAGHTPCAPVVSPDGGKLYVCNKYGDTVSVIDLANGRDTKIIPMMREPAAAVISPDGQFLFVANHLPTGNRIYEYITDGGILMIGSYISSGYFSGTRESYAVACVVLVVDLATNRLIELIALPNGSTAVKGLCISPDGKYVYASHILGRYQLPTTQADRGWINTNAMSVIDVDRLRLQNTVLLDDIDRGAANPWGIACSPDGAALCVAHSGSHELSIIDRPALHDRLDSFLWGRDIPGASKTTEDVPNDLAFLTGIRRRIQLDGNGPRGIAVVGDKVYAAEYFSDSIAVADMRPGNERDRESIMLGAQTPLTAERKGNMYFYDADLCFQNWQSCASCHPDDRVDALNWDNLNDGIGNPKNTKSLLLSHKTPPVMATGIRSTAEIAVRAGLRHIQFTEKPDEIASCIDSFLMSMKPIPSPYLVKGRLGKEAKRGKKIFAKAGCLVCHPPPYYTDLQSYDVGTGTGREQDEKFDTPTLIEVWRTAPYLYDGRSDTMYEVLTNFNKQDKHGVTSNLSRREMFDLVEFVLSL